MAEFLSHTELLLDCQFWFWVERWRDICGDFIGRWGQGGGDGRPKRRVFWSEGNVSTFSGCWWGPSASDWTKQLSCSISRAASPLTGCLCTVTCCCRLGLDHAWETAMLSLSLRIFATVLKPMLLKLLPAASRVFPSSFITELGLPSSCIGLVDNLLDDPPGRLLTWSSCTDADMARHWDSIWNWHKWQ